MRALRVRVPRKGVRTRVLLVVTTLLTPATFPKEAIAELYRCRWHAELDLRAIKTALGMDIVRGKTPAMVRKELWMYVLAYNMIRAVMVRAALSNRLGNGQTLNLNQLASRCPSLGTRGAGLPNPVAVKACINRIGLHVQQVYQPGNRYWTFQGIESAIFVTLAVGLLALSAWWVRRRIV